MNFKDFWNFFRLLSPPFFLQSLGFFVLGGSLLFAIDISPSKYQGGVTNNPPYKVEGAPQLLKNPFKWVFGSPRSEAMQRVTAPPNFKADLVAEPKNFMASTNSSLKVRMIAINQGKEKYVLEFATAQHYDFIIKNNKDGKEVYRASANKIYSQQFSTVLVNRNDKLVYEEELFSPTNSVVNLSTGEYRLIGLITAQVPISVEKVFQVSP